MAFSVLPFIFFALTVFCLRHVGATRVRIEPEARRITVTQERWVGLRRMVVAGSLDDCDIKARFAIKGFSLCWLLTRFGCIWFA